MFNCHSCDQGKMRIGFAALYGQRSIHVKSWPFCYKSLYRRSHKFWTENFRTLRKCKVIETHLLEIFFHLKLWADGEERHDDGPLLGVQAGLLRCPMNLQEDLLAGVSTKKYETNCYGLLSENEMCCSGKYGNCTNVYLFNSPKTLPSVKYPIKSSYNNSCNKIICQFSLQLAFY